MSTFSLLLSAAAALIATPVTPQGYDFQTHKVRLQGALASMNMESLQTSVGKLRLMRGEAMVSGDAAQRQLVQNAEVAIEGQGVLLLDQDATAVRVDLSEAPLRQVGRRIEITVWVLSQGAQAEAQVAWLGGNEQTGDRPVLGAIKMQPTGAVTRDGWEELTSGPLDAATAGLVPSRVVIRARAAEGGDFSLAVDGLAIWDRGPKQVPEASCSLPTEAQVCGAEGACMYGRCMNASMVLGPAIYNPELRRQYIQRRIFEVERFSGTRASIPLIQQRLRPQLEALIPTSVGTRVFRETLHTAYLGILDGHASGPSARLPRPRPNGGLCMYIGRADLFKPGSLPNDHLVPLVFESDAANGLQLQPGDALVAVDGLEPRAWMKLAGRYLFFTGDPRAREVVDTPHLINAAIRTGAKLTFARCQDPQGCTKATASARTIDLAAAMQPYWQDGAADPFSSDRVCDFRFTPSVNDANSRKYMFAGHSTTNDGVRRVQINGTPGVSMEGGEAWGNAVNQAFADAPNRVILDQRRGDGGNMDAVDRVASHLMDSSELRSAEIYPMFGVDLTPGLRQSLRSCTDRRRCGYVLIERYGQSGIASTSSQARLAVLLGSDVSGNDFLSGLLSWRQAPVRFFGPAPTWGGFGPVWDRVSYLVDYRGGRYQFADTVFPRGDGDTRLNFTTGVGVAPDQVIYQTQSDLLRGVDTILSAAQAWVRGN